MNSNDLKHNIDCMKSQGNKISLIIICCLLAFSCAKDALPFKTSNGSDTMGFIVNGDNWIAHSNDFKLSRTSAKYWTTYGLVVLGYKDSNSNMSFVLKNPKTGTYQFTTDDKVEYDLFSAPYKYSLDLSSTTNTLNITRCDNSVVAGSFSFKLKSVAGEVVNITSGRFDISVSQ